MSICLVEFLGTQVEEGLGISSPSQGFQGSVLHCKNVPFFVSVSSLDRAALFALCGGGLCIVPSISLFATLSK